MNRGRANSECGEWRVVKAGRRKLNFCKIMVKRGLKRVNFVLILSFINKNGGGFGDNFWFFY